MKLNEFTNIKINNFVFYEDSKGKKHKFHVAEIVGCSYTPLGLFNIFKLLPLEKTDTIEKLNIKNHWKYTKKS